MGFEGSLCLKPLAFQKLYSCVEAERLTDNRDETPWTWHACLAPDELGTEACAALLPEIRSKCTGSESLTTETAGQYSCSPECAGSLVSVISQCQTSLATRADQWTENTKTAFQLLVSRDPVGPCRRTFTDMVTARVVQIENG